MFLTQSCGNKAHFVVHTLCELQLRSCCCNPLARTPLYTAGSTQTWIRSVIFGCQKSRCSCTYTSKTINVSTFVFPDTGQINYASESTVVLLGLFLMQLPSQDCFASLNSCTLQRERTQTWLAQYIAKENRKICNCHIAKIVIQHIYICYKYSGPTYEDLCSKTIGAQYLNLHARCISDSFAQVKSFTCWRTLGAFPMHTYLFHSIWNQPRPCDLRLPWNVSQGTVNGDYQENHVRALLIKPGW